MITEETIRRLAEQDARLRKTFRPVVLEQTGVSLLRHAQAILDGQAEAAQAEKTLSERVREILEKERAVR